MAYKLGIEISPSLFKLVEVKKSWKRVTLHQVVAHPLPSVWSNHSTLFEKEEFIQTVQEALLSREFHTNQASVAINSNHFILKQVTVPRMSKRKYRKWIEEYLLPVLDLPFSEAYFDFQLINHVWASDEEQEILLALSPRSYVDQLTKCLEYCGLEIERVDVTPLCLYRWVHFDHVPPSPQLILIHLSKNQVEISYFLEGQCLSACVVPILMTDFLTGIDRPHVDPLTPILQSETEIEAYGRALVEHLYRGLSEALVSRFQYPNTRWILTGEGLDIYLLENILRNYVSYEVQVGPLAERVMSPFLKDRASRWIGTSFSVPIGLTLNRKEGGER